VDPRVLEDAQGSLEVEAATSTPGPNTSFAFTYRSAAVAFHGPGAPPSRNAPCQTQAPSGALTPLTPCPFTNGNLNTPVSPTGTASAVESSPDATTWSSLGGILSVPSALTPTTPRAARYLRVRTASGTALSGLTQISAWG
jgi:hypothetical protein